MKSQNADQDWAGVGFLHLAHHLLFLVLFQVGSAAFCQLAIRFLCSEAGRLANFTRIGRLCLLLERGNAEIQVAILTWMIETEAGKGLTFSKDLQLTLLVRPNFIHNFIWFTIYVSRQSPVQALIRPIFNNLLPIFSLFLTKLIIFKAANRRSNSHQQNI